MTAGTAVPHCPKINLDLRPSGGLRIWWRVLILVICVLPLGLVDSISRVSISSIPVSRGTLSTRCAGLLMRVLTVVLGLFFCSSLICRSLIGAELTPREQQMAKAINSTVQKAGASFAEGNFEAAATKIRQAMKQVTLATEQGSSNLHDALQPAIQRISKAHTMLEFEGMSLPPFRVPKRPESGTDDDMQKTQVAEKPKPRPTRTTRKPVPRKPEPAATSMISFTKTVGPILANRCGRCHASGSKGDFSLATYAALMKGPPEGVVIFAGDTVGSRLIETIETGDMPRGGGKVTPQELQMLKAWIVAGAKFDGPDPNAPISGSVTPPGPTQTKRLQTRRSTGKETVSFAADVAPLLVDNCNGCHIDAMQTRGGLRMDTFAQLLRGGDSGDVIAPGKGEQSLLVQKLRGMGDGARMPAGGRAALSDASIELISTWIDEGATLDGASETQPLRVMSQLAWAKSATPSQLSLRRQELAEKNMKLVTASGGSVQSKSTEHFHVIGSASHATLDIVGRLAEDQMKTAKTVVPGGSGEAYFDGRATIFVLPKRYDYSEFAKMAEGRSIPSDWTSHWRFDGINAYVSIVATDRDDEDAIEDRLLSPITSLAVATRGGDVPRWIAEGVGAATASRKSNQRDREARRRLEAETSQALAAMKNAKQFLDNKLTPQQTDRIGAAIATSLLDRAYRRNFDGLLRNLAGGKPFEQAFVGAFGVPPTAFIDKWMKWARGG